MQWAPLFVRFCSLLLGSFALFLGARLAQTGAAPPFVFALYVARLAFGVSLAIALPALVLVALERGVRWGKALAVVVLLAGLFPLIRPISVHLASGDGLRARGISADLTQWGSTALLLVSAAAVWSYRYWARARFLDLLLGAAFSAGLLGTAALLGRAQLELASLLQGYALVLSVLLLHAALPRYRSPRVAGGAAALVLAPVLLGLFLPGPLARGRRLALLTEPAVGLVAGQLEAGPPLRPSSIPSPEACAALLRVPDLGRIELPAERRRNVILVSIDTVRADYVKKRSVGGAELMPGLTQFMRESRHAERAQTAFPATLLALASAFTGNSPSDLLLSPKPYATLFSLTRDRFQHVEAVLPDGQYFARPDVQTFLARDVKWSMIGRARPQVAYTIELLRSLRERDQSHLIWIHFVEPHEPYRKHDEFDYGDTDEQRYMSELAYVDAQLAELLDVLRQEGWFDDSLIAVFADHGESFGEHQHRFHHYLLYPWLVSVPFALHYPGVVPGPFAGPVQLMDLTPSVLQFLDQPASRPFRGLPLLGGDPPAERDLISEEISMTGRQLSAARAQPAQSEADVIDRMAGIERGLGYSSKLAITRGPWELIEHRRSRAVELYDVGRDPRAERDLADTRPEVARVLSQAALKLRENMVQRALCELAPAAP